ncbi:MAG: PepSY domain-containing protein [Muribaculaceae bacterium]|nr:PepSY domain-containing protein [Muribaculaceae bacterium]
MRIIRLIHRWTGLVIGLFFIFSCLSGLIIVFGKIIGSYSPIFKVARQCHTDLYLGNTGEEIIAIATLLAVVEIITGYILWFQRTIKMGRGLRIKHQNPLIALKKNLNFSFPNKLSGFHSAGGFWSGIPLLLMAMTALTWCFGWYSDIVYSLFESDNTGDWNNNLYHTLHALHVGSWEDMFSRLLWLVAVAIGISLPVTGLLLYLHRHHRRKGSSW